MIAECVLGPPGCGKTTHLRNTMKSLIDSGYSLNDITFVSHTAAAANEMLTRLALPRSDKVCTLHALCFRLMRLGSRSVIGTRHLKELEAKINIPFSGRKAEDEGQEVGDQYLDIMSFARNKMISYEDAYWQSDRPGNHAQFLFFCEAYNHWKATQFLIDFTDMLERYQSAPVSDGSKILMVDEAQDLSNLQWDIIDGLIAMGDYERIIVVGDDDQSIYVWGGADTLGMQKFTDKYKAGVVVLDQSYRVPCTVHQLSQNLIQRVSNRMTKGYRPRDEEGKISEWISFDGLLSGGAPTEDTLIIGRTHSVVHELEHDLVANLVPYSKEGGRPGMLENRYAMAIRAFRKLQAGGELSKAEQGAYGKVAYSRYAEGYGLAGKRFDAVLDIPFSFAPYYNNVDIDAEPNIRLSTIHSSKGKEAERVIISTELTPRILEGMAKSMDDEIRVMYVGVTRAKRLLDVVSTGFDLFEEN